MKKEKKKNSGISRLRQGYGVASRDYGITGILSLLKETKEEEENEE